MGVVAETRKNESDVTAYIPDRDDIDKQKIFLQKHGITPSLRKDVIRVHALSKTCILFLSNNKPMTPALNKIPPVGGPPPPESHLTTPALY